MPNIPKSTARITARFCIVKEKNSNQPANKKIRDFYAMNFVFERDFYESIKKNLEK